MKTNDEILDQLTCCTIDDNADLDVKENFYYKYEDVIKAMNEARTQANGAEQSTSNCIKPAVSNAKRTVCTAPKNSYPCQKYGITDGCYDCPFKKVKTDC